MTARTNILPSSLPPRGLSRSEAAAFICVSTTLFGQMVLDGRMPKPKKINTRLVWDRVAVEHAFDALPDEGAATVMNPWDRAIEERTARGVN